MQSEFDTGVEYHPEQLHTPAVQSLLEQMCETFTFFHGSFARFLDIYGADALRAAARAYFLAYVRTVDFGNLDLLASVRGIQYLPVDKNAYLRIQCFVNAVEFAFPQVAHTAFLYHDHLVWSGLDAADMRTLFRHVVDDLPTSRSASMCATPRRGAPLPPQAEAGYVTGAIATTVIASAAELAPGAAQAIAEGRSGGSDGNQRVHEEEEADAAAAAAVANGTLTIDRKVWEAARGPAVRVFLRPDDQECFLACLRFRGAMVVFLLAHDDASVDDDFFVTLEAYVTQQLGSLTEALADNAAAASASTATGAQLGGGTAGGGAGTSRGGGGGSGRKRKSETGGKGGGGSGGGGGGGGGGGDSDDEEEFKYVYFNRMNLATKTSLGGRGAVSGAAMRLMTRVHEDFDEHSERITEMFIKTEDDGWVVGRRSDSREVYVSFDRKKANLIEVNGAVIGGGR